MTAQRVLHGSLLFCNAYFEYVIDKYVYVCHAVTSACSHACHRAACRLPLQPRRVVVPWPHGTQLVYIFPDCLSSARTEEAASCGSSLAVPRGRAHPVIRILWINRWPAIPSCGVPECSTARLSQHLPHESMQQDAGESAQAAGHSPHEALALRYRVPQEASNADSHEVILAPPVAVVLRLAHRRPQNLAQHAMRRIRRHRSAVCRHDRVRKHRRGKDPCIDATRHSRSVKRAAR